MLPSSVLQALHSPGSSVEGQLWFVLLDSANIYRKTCSLKKFVNGDHACMAAADPEVDLCVESVDLPRFSLRFSLGCIPSGLCIFVIKIHN
jgi:hypothetical protein